jgi:uncharacterized protein YdhG (YjbR/CyaY superfamily)
MNEVEKYISQFEPEIQERLKVLCQAFWAVIPDTQASIRYQMPAFKVGNHFLYFAAYTNHIGFYPVYGLPSLEDEMKEYRAKKTKDTLHFNHSKPLSIALIKKIIRLKADL